MKKALTIGVMFVAVACAGGATVWMLAIRNDPPPPPPDPRPCITAAINAGMERQKVEQLMRVAQGKGEAVESIQTREELRRRDIPECRSIAEQLGGG